MTRIRPNQIQASATVGEVVKTTSAGVVGWGSSTGELAFVGKRTGVLAVGAGTARLYNDTGRTLTIFAVRATVETSPTGASILVDVNKNGTTIFTTQSNRPTIAAAGTTAKAAAINVASWADGEYLTFDVDQIGSTIPGSDLTVQVTAR
jgi:hypothetical protein